MRSGLGWWQRTQIRLSDCGTMEDDATSRLHWKSLFIVTVQTPECCLDSLEVRRWNSS